MLVTNTPVSSRPTPSTSTPRPGTWRSVSMLACAEAGQQRLRRGEQPGEHAVHHAQHPRQHPDGDGQRRPDQQAGDQVLLHAGFRGGRARLVGGRRRRTGAAAAGVVVGCRRRGLAGASAGFRLGLVIGCRGVAWPPRKSVAYQPEPFSWKPAAVSCLAKPPRRRPGRCSARDRTSSAARPAGVRRTRTCRRRSACGTLDAKPEL